MLVKKLQAWWDNPTGWCYAASEALYYYLGGKASLLTPKQLRIDLVTLQPFSAMEIPELAAKPNSVSHWWLEDREGNIIDPTSDQFNWVFPYHLGRGRGFMPKMKADSVELLAYLRS